MKSKQYKIKGAMRLLVYLTLYCLILVPQATLADDNKGVSLEDKAALLQVLPSDHMIGNDDATVTIVEYASLSCSHCAAFHKEVFPVIKEKYIDTGKVKFLYRDFPLNPPALYAAKLTHCIDDRKFMPFVKTLFETQESWAYHRNYIEILSNIAKLSGYDPMQVDNCLQNAELEELILEQRLKAANILGVKSTPSFFVNGELFKNADIASFSAVLDKKLSSKEK